MANCDEKTYASPSPSKVIHTLVIFLTILHTSGAICSKIIPHNCTCFDDPLTVLCVSKNLTSFPRNLPNAIHMTSQDNSITAITKSIPYYKLQSLILDGNRISYIADRAFENLGNLTKLSVAHNRLSNLTADTFYGLQALKFLILDHNPIFQIVPSMLSGGHLRSLQILKLSHCNIRTIHRGVFYGTPMLQYLDLSHNAISKFPEFAELGNLLQLQQLDMSHNRISSIGEYRCERLASLKLLLLSNNNISVVSPQSLLGALDSLTALDLSENRLANMSSALRNATVLTDLLLQNNSFRELDESTLPWHSLQKLLVHDNPWHCDCAASWLVKYAVVAQWNANKTTRCASPPSLAGRLMLDVGDNVFANCTQVRGRRVSAVALISVSIAVCVVLVTIAATFTFLVQKGVFLIGRGRKYQPSALMMSISNAAPPYRRV